MKDIDKLIETVPGLTLDEQFALINESKSTGYTLHLKRPGTPVFTF